VWAVIDARGATYILPAQPMEVMQAKLINPGSRILLVGACGSSMPVGHQQHLSGPLGWGARAVGAREPAERRAGFQGVVQLVVD
jgi:hypothetical protein